MDDIISTNFNAILVGEADTVKKDIQIALDAKIDPTTILNEGMIAAMRGLDSVLRLVSIMSRRC